VKNTSLIVIWVLFFIVLFCAGFIITHTIVTKVMADFSEPTVTGLTTLEVKPNFGTQTDQYTPIQPSVTPIGKEL
jgi:hypothetical protein